MCATCKPAIRNAKKFAAAITAAVIDLPCRHRALHRLAQCGQRYVYTRGVAASGPAASCWVDEWATPVLVSSVPVDVCLASCIFWISLRTSARIASCRWLVSRCRKRAKRWFARWARRHTRAKAVHALHTCVLFWVYFRLCCQAVNSARGLRSLHWEHCQQPRCLVVHSLQQRRSAWRAFHAAGPNSASGFAAPHLKHGFLTSHVKHTRKTVEVTSLDEACFTSRSFSNEAFGCLEILEDVQAMICYGHVWCSSEMLRALLENHCSLEGWELKQKSGGRLHSHERHATISKVQPPARRPRQNFLGSAAGGVAP